MKKLFAVFSLLVLFTGCASSMETRAVMAPPMECEKALSPGLQAVDVFIENTTVPLGAYHLEVHYDPRVVVIEKITPAPGEAVAASPVADAASFASGLSGIVGIIPGEGAQAGKIHVARIYFRPVSSGKTPLSVSIRSLYSPASSPINGAVSLSDSEITVP